MFPTRGVPGGWVDPWDDPDDHAALRAQAERAKRLALARARALSFAWRREVEDERQAV